MDIVGRLRSVSPDKDGSRPKWYINPDGTEAADEIERLRQQNAELLDGLRELSDEGWNCCNISKAMKKIAQDTITKATGGE